MSFRTLTLPIFHWTGQIIVHCLSGRRILWGGPGMGNRTRPQLSTGQAGFFTAPTDSHLLVSRMSLASSSTPRSLKTGTFQPSPNGGRVVWYRLKAESQSKWDGEAISFNAWALLSKTIGDLKQRCQGSPKFAFACPPFYSTGSVLWFQQAAMLSPTLPLLEACLFVTHWLIACIRKSTASKSRAKPFDFHSPGVSGLQVLMLVMSWHATVLIGILVLLGLISDLISYNLKGTIQGLRRLSTISLRSASAKE